MNKIFTLSLSWWNVDHAPTAQATVAIIMVQ